MDTLSRIPRKQCGRSGTEETSQPVNVMVLDGLEDMRKAQLEDEDVGPILKAKEAGMAEQELNRQRRSNSKNLLMLIGTDWQSEMVYWCGNGFARITLAFAGK
ncbi:hypothetical protein D918_09542 [Trichuris suis]|uniref:Uncharacterized protein n=1 Tax=Trichuris suis TaxID=68888 RepID=A0A085LNH5_9BILA|nr:hypothetical protein M513_12606 [Trichuris suis]KHJ40401.1 hypothetical protein D918_09542 [Trichuris suis]